MNKILRIWRYATIVIIVSLLTLSIFVLGCTTDSISKKNKKFAVMNDPIVTYWHCWWRINHYYTVSSGFELLHRYDIKSLNNSHETKSERFFHSQSTKFGILKSYKFYNAFPTALSPITLDWGASEIEEFTCTWTYDYWLPA